MLLDMRIPRVQDKTNETFDFDSSTARISTRLFPLEALPEKSSHFISPRTPGGWSKREKIHCAQRDNPKPPMALQMFARIDLRC